MGRVESAAVIIPPMNGEPAPEPEPPTNGAPQSLTGLLKQILFILNQSFFTGQSRHEITIISLDTGATFQQIFPATKLVKKAIIQNISTEAVTIISRATGTVSQGIILNPADLAGQGGGSLPTGNVDLSKLWFRRVTSGVTLAVYRET